MKRIFWLLLFLLQITFLQAQKNNIVLSGYVTDSLTGEKLLGAEVMEVNSGRGILTNEYGYFHLQVPKRNKITVRVQFLGYKTYEKVLDGTKNLHLDIRLVPGEELEEVVIKAMKEGHAERLAEMSKITLKTAEIKNVPVIFSEPDVVKIMTLLPGVQQGTEGFGGMYVRGGGMDQNLFLLDDVPLYYVNHLGGFISVFNNDAINQVTLYKGDFPARYGNRLSSVLDVQLREGNKHNYHGILMLGMLSSKFTFEGPIIKDRTSFIVSARRFPYDLLMRPISRLASGGMESLGYTFYDFNVKINHKLSAKDNLDVSWYYGEDAFLNKFYNENILEAKDRVAWGNHLISLRWKKELTSKLFANTTFSYTRYRFLVSSRADIGNYTSTVKYISGIRDITLKTDMDYLLNNLHAVKFGGGIVFHRFKPGVISIKESDTQTQTDTVVGDYGLQSREMFSYVQWKASFGKRFKGRVGLRLNAYDAGPKTFVSVEPRISLNYLIKENLSVKASYAQMQQNVHLLTSSGVGLPVDLWMPATVNVPPSHARQVALGLAQTLPGGTWDWTLEAYYKHMKGLISYKPGASFAENVGGNWENNVAKNGTGQSYGLELLLRKRKGKWTGWASYTYSKSMRRFDLINGGKSYPFKYDRRHALNLVGQIRLKPGVLLSGLWTYGTGYPVTLPIGQFTTPDLFNGQFNTFYYNYDTYYIYTSKNSFRMRAYHRLDLSISFTKQKKYGARTWTVGIYNLYNRKNPFYYFVGWDDRTEQWGVIQVSMFPVLPSVSYTYKF